MKRTTPRQDPGRTRQGPETRGPVGTFGLVNDELPVECWCHATIVHAPAALVLECRTVSCGRPGCAES